MSKYSVHNERKREKERERGGEGKSAILSPLSGWGEVSSQTSGFAQPGGAEGGKSS